ncbi:hypothetical protein HA466_0258490 [Hirschfeldia incana]|nr:hypothetical protein HA466_0258490 [Hirschfeldia incana]
MHQPGIEPGSVPWQGTILPLDHCLATMVLLLIVLTLIEESQIVDARPLKHLGISSIPKKTGDHGLNISSKLETEDHSLDAFRPTKPGNSPGIGH